MERDGHVVCWDELIEIHEVRRREKKWRFGMWYDFPPYDHHHHLRYVFESPVWGHQPLKKNPFSVFCILFFFGGGGCGGYRMGRLFTILLVFCFALIFLYNCVEYYHSISTRQVTPKRIQGGRSPYYPLQWNDTQWSNEHLKVKVSNPYKLIHFVVNLWFNRHSLLHTE